MDVFLDTFFNWQIVAEAWPILWQGLKATLLLSALVVYRLWSPRLQPAPAAPEPHPEGGKGDDGKPRQMWFALQDQPIGFFAGLSFRFHLCITNKFS